MRNIDKIARYVVSRRYNHGKPINAFDLQKVLKQIQDETHYFYDERESLRGISVKCYPNVYYHFCGYGVMPITYSYSVNISTKLKNKINPIIDTFVDTTTRILNE